MPGNSKDGLLWRNWLITQNLQKDYMTLQQFREQIQKWNGHVVFSTYSFPKTTPTIFLRDLLEKHGGRDKNYWRLAAPVHLNP